MTQDSDNSCWWGQDGTAIFAWSLALQRHLIFSNPLELCLSLLWSFPLKRIEREVTVQVNWRLWDWFRFRFVFCCFIIYL